MYEDELPPDRTPEEYAEHCDIREPHVHVDGYQTGGSEYPTYLATTFDGSHRHRRDEFMRKGCAWVQMTSWNEHRGHKVIS